MNGDSYRWFASHPFTSRVIGGEVNFHPPFALHPERFKEWDCFVSVNPASPTPRIKARDTDVSYITNILVDVDPNNDSPIPEHHREKIANLVRYEFSQAFGYDISFTCNFSGRGIQFLLDVIEYPVTTNALRADWRSSVKRFLLDLSTRFKIPYEAHIDTCTSDLSRLRRAEGTINQTSKAMAYHMLTTDGTAIDPHHFLSLYRAEKIESFSEYERSSLQNALTGVSVSLTRRRYTVTTLDCLASSTNLEKSG